MDIGCIHPRVGLGSVDRSCWLPASRELQRGLTPARSAGVTFVCRRCRLTWGREGALPALLESHLLDHGELGVGGRVVGNPLDDVLEDPLGIGDELLLEIEIGLLDAINDGFV